VSEQQRKKLRDASDELLATVAELRALEREKRRHDISSPEFQRLAAKIEQKSRQVFRAATREQDIVEEMSSRQRGTSDDIPNVDGGA
jgi:hypothetical protein